MSAIADNTSRRPVLRSTGTANSDLGRMDESVALPENDSVFAGVGEGLIRENYSSDVLMEDSFSSFVGGAASSTPPNTPRTTKKSRGSRFAEGLMPPPKLPCPTCGKRYANEKTLSVYMKWHSMKVATNRAPKLLDLQTKMGELFQNVIQDMMKEKKLGQLGVDVQVYLQFLSAECELNFEVFQDICDFLSDAFYNILNNEKSLFPSTIRSTVLIGVNKLLGSPNFTKCLKGKFWLIKDPCDSVLNVFISSLMLALSSKVLIYAMQNMLDTVGQVSEVRKKRSSDDRNSDTFKQMVYYIAGSILCGLLWKGRHCLASNQAWNVFIGAIQKKFLQDETEESACAQTVRAFTESRDRGGLKRISTDAFEFFWLLFDKIMSLEGEDGSLPPNIIDEHLLNDDMITFLWDAVSHDVLDDEQSLELLMIIATCCVGVAAKGILKRRLNESILKAFSSVPLRARLAR